MTFSRDALVDVLEDVADAPGVDRIALLSHSMGSWLTMEALRQLRLESRDATVAEMNEVVLAAPDIDVDVFLKQLQIVEKLRIPLTVLVSRDDGALRLSSFLAGDRDRVGLADIDDPRVQAAAKLYDVRVIDVSSITTSGDLGHGRYASIASIYTRLRERLEARNRGRSLSGAGVFLLGPAQVLDPRPTRTAKLQ